MERGKKDTFTLQCVTVRLPCNIFPHPLPGLSFTAFFRKGVGGGGETGSAQHFEAGPHPYPKTVAMMTIGGEGCSSLCPHDLAQRMCIIHHYNASSKRPPSRKTKQRKQNPKNNPRERREEKQNTRRGGDLGEGEGDEVQVEHVVRGQDEETQGGSQTPKGVWVSPAPEKERKKKTTPATIQTQEREREREREGTTNIWAYRGQVLKGTKPNSIPTPETKRTNQNTQHPSQRNLTKTKHKTKHKTSKVSEDLSLQGGGAHGPPCPLGESPQGTVVPRGPKTPPTTGTAPGGAKHDNIPSTETDTPRGEPSSSPAL